MEDIIQKNIAERPDLFERACDRLIEDIGKSQRGLDGGIWDMVRKEEERLKRQMEGEDGKDI